MALQHWLADLPTRIHLWCAERELRRVPESAGSPARADNLALLRDYRRTREFPRHSQPRPTPCFVDSGGRHCAVAHLMARAGADEAVERVRGRQNFARLPEMDLEPLRDWQRRSGLSPAELARIQPTYRPEAEFQILWIAFVQFVFSPFALASIIVNLFRLNRGRLRATARWAGAVLGSLLLLGVVLIAVIDLTTSEYSVTVPWLFVGTLGALGLLSLAAVWLNRRRAAVRDELLAG